MANDNFYPKLFTVKVWKCHQDLILTSQAIDHRDDIILATQQLQKGHFVQNSLRRARRIYPLQGNEEGAESQHGGLKGSRGYAAQDAFSRRTGCW